MGNSQSKNQCEMSDYVRGNQQKSGWNGALEPVLKCCIKTGSMKGFCSTCMENFRYKNGSYYDGFVYPDDGDLLERMSSGLKPLASFARRERDEYLEMDIKQRGLHLVRVFRNTWGVLIYDVVKDPEIKLSDLAELSRLSEILGFEVRDRPLIDLEDDDSLTLVEVGLKYGYPFYTLPRKAYVSVTSQLDKEVDDVASEMEEMPLECIEAFLKERSGYSFDINAMIREEMRAMIEEE